MKQLVISPELKNDKNKVLEIKSDLVNIDLNLRELSPQQLFKLNSIDNEIDKLKYLLSFSKLNRKALDNNPKIKKLSTLKAFKDDSLADKPKDSILNKLRSMCNASSEKRPASNNFHFGIEIECILTYDSVDASPSSSGYCECYTCEGRGRVDYQHRDSGHEIESECPTCDGSGEIESEDSDNDQSEEALNNLMAKIRNRAIKNCHVKTDGSIDVDDSSESFGVEISCLTTDFKNLKKLCDLLEDLNAQVNASCGLHVHLDARHYKTQFKIEELRLDNELTSLGHNQLLDAMPYLFEMLPKSRRGNTYCKLGRNYEDRYHAVNMTAFSKFSTIEIRAHSGTVNYEKIYNWCNILKIIFQNKPKNNITSFKTLLSAFDFSPELKKYMGLRRSKFTVDDDSLEFDNDSEVA